MREYTHYTSLPLLSVGQSHKEITVNEALIRIDMILCGIVDHYLINVPPEEYEHHKLMILGDKPEGGWASHPYALAFYCHGWRFIFPWEGAEFRLRNSEERVRFERKAWKIITMEENKYEKH